MFNKKNKGIFLGLIGFVIVCMTISGLLVFMAMRDTSAGTEENTAENISGQLDSDSNNSQELTTITSSEATELSSEQILSWAEFIPEVQWLTEDNNNSWDENSSTTIILNKNSITVNGSGAASNGATVTISESGTYVISGSIENGQILVDADDNSLIFLVLNNAEISNSQSAPVYIKNAGKTVIIANSGSTNKINDLRAYTESENYTSSESESDTSGEDDTNIDAAIFSKDDLSITGTGIIEITTEWAKGISGRDNLLISNVNIVIDSADDGIRGKDLLALDNTNISIESGGDGIRSNNSTDETLGHIIITSCSINIISEQDGIQALGQLVIENSEIEIYTADGSSQALSERQTNPQSGEFGDRGQNPGRMQGASPEDQAGNFPENMNPRNNDQTGEFMPEDISRDVQENGANLDNTNLPSSSDDSTLSTKGLKSNIAVKITNGIITVDSADDSIHSDGIITIENSNLDLSTGDDGIHADLKIIINSGTILIRESYEGIESKEIIINGGDINITASDDGINVAGSQDSSTFGGRPGQMNTNVSDDQRLEINGGTIVVDAQGDGIDVNGSAYMTGGTVIVYGPSSNNEGALDYDGNFTLTGGTLLAVGSSGMAQSVSSSSQQVLSFTTNIAAETELIIYDSNGKEMISFSSPRQFSSVIYTSPELISGDTYEIYSEGVKLGEINI